MPKNPNSIVAKTKASNTVAILDTGEIRLGTENRKLSHDDAHRKAITLGRYHHTYWYELQTALIVS